jgi:hypothetical protein
MAQAGSLGEPKALLCDAFSQKMEVSRIVATHLLLAHSSIDTRFLSSPPFPFHWLTKTSTLGTTTWLIRKRHAITRAELAFLLLNERIIEMHVVLDGRYILMPQQFLERVNVTTEHEVAHGESMAEDVRADTLALRQISPLANALKQHVHAATSEGKTALAQKNVIFTWVAKLHQAITIRTIAVDVEQQRAQRIATKRDAPLLVPLTMHDHRTPVAVKIRQPQIAEFRQPYPRIPQHPQDSAVASGVDIGDRAGFMRRRTRLEHALELFKLNDTDHWPANFGHLDVMAGSHLHVPLSFHPVTKRAHRARIAVDRALGELPPFRTRFRSHVGEPGEDMYALDVLDEDYVLLFQKIGEVAERKRMPLDRLGAVVLAAVIEDVLINGRGERAFRPRRGTLANPRG